MTFFKRFRTQFIIVLISTTILLFALIAHFRGQGADTHGDFFVYWEAGKHFMNGEKLYTPGLDDGGFTYPPFAALCFSIFAFFSFHTAASLFTFIINFGLWIPSFLLTQKILKIYYPHCNFKYPILMAALLSAGFFWHNLIWMNANLPVLVLTLAGLYYFNIKRYTLSYLCFAAGAFLKITPVIFLFFIAIKRGPRHWPLMALSLLPFLLIPILLRGLSQGLMDWVEYYQAFIGPFGRGQVDHNAISLGLPALVHKLSIGDPDVPVAPLTLLSVDRSRSLIIAVQILCVLGLTAKILYDRMLQKKRWLSPLDICLIFLMTLLLPGRVWPHHHVCVAFIYTFTFHLLIRQKRYLLLIVTTILCLFNNFITSSMIGQYLTGLFKHFSYATILMVFVAVILLLMTYRENRSKRRSTWTDQRIDGQPRKL